VGFWKNAQAALLSLIVFGKKYGPLATFASNVKTPAKI
jgi:hypothetical protein